MDSAVDRGQVSLGPRNPSQNDATQDDFNFDLAEYFERGISPIRNASTAESLLNELEEQRRILLNRISRSGDPTEIDGLENELIELDELIKTVDRDGDKGSDSQSASMYEITDGSISRNDTEDVTFQDLTGISAATTEKSSSQDRHNEAQSAAGPSSTAGDQPPPYSSNHEKAQRLQQRPPSYAESIAISDGSPPNSSALSSIPGGSKTDQKAKEPLLIDLDYEGDVGHNNVKRRRLAQEVQNHKIQVEQDRQLALELQKKWETATVIDDDEDDVAEESLTKQIEADHDLAQKLQMQQDAEMQNGNPRKSLWDSDKKDQKWIGKSDELSNSRHMGQFGSPSPSRQLHTRKDSGSDSDVQIIGENRDVFSGDSRNSALTLNRTEGNFGHQQEIVPAVSKQGFLCRLKMGLSSLLRFYTNVDDFRRDSRVLMSSRRRDKRIMPLIGRAYRALVMRDKINQRVRRRKYGTGKQSQNNTLFDFTGFGGHSRRDLARYREVIDLTQETLHNWATYSANESDRDIEADIRRLLENIKPNEEIKPENREGTPKGLVPALMEHQKEGLMWLKKAEEGDHYGGLLADGMGLGKTVQMLALMVANPSKNEQRRATLVVCPVSLLQQWRREIQTKTNVGGRPLSVHIHHGQTKNLIQSQKLPLFDVVLTTYNTVAFELKDITEYEKRRRQGPSKEDDDDAKKEPSCPILNTEWYRIILDESQVMKNRQTLVAKAMARLKGDSKFCLTGTPIQNSVEEIFTTIQFLGIKPYNNWTQFSKDFAKPFKQKGAASETAMRRMQVLLSTMMLRRTKMTKVDGRPIIEMVPKLAQTIEVTLSEEERDFYDRLEQRAQLTISRYMQQNAVSRHYGNLLVLLLRLRQAVCHTDLAKVIEQIQVAEQDESVARALAMKLQPETVQRIKNEPSFECGICLDPVFSPIFAIPCGHFVCEDCLVRLVDQATAQNPNSEEISCPLCRAKIKNGQFITDKIFRSVYGIIPALEAAQRLDQSEQDEQEKNIVKEQHLDQAVMLPGNQSEDEEQGRKDEAKEADNRSDSDYEYSSKLKKEAHFKGLGHRKGKRQDKRNTPKILPPAKPSAKVIELMKLIERIRVEFPGEKIIVFSQFREFLGLIEREIYANHNWSYAKYDGSLTPKQRDDAIFRFNEDPDLIIFLVSLKAGNVGLNLTAANHIIMLDPYWNPAIEDQAIDRAHRIGQTRTVYVYKFLVKQSVEERVLRLQETKRKLISGILEENASKEIARLSSQELGFLFGISH